MRVTQQFHAENNPYFEEEVSTRSILVVDSNRQIAKSIEQAIHQINHNYLGCVQTVGGLEKFISITEPDFIIVNIATQGEFDGYQLTKLIKLDYEIPFCILYEDTNAREKKWADELNPDGFISYSSNILLLGAQLKEFLY